MTALQDDKNSRTIAYITVYKGITISHGSFNNRAIMTALIWTKIETARAN